MPSREHFLLNLLSALSTDSFSPTLIVDILFQPSFAYAVIFFNYLFIIQKPLIKVNFLRAHFPKFYAAHF